MAVPSLGAVVCLVLFVCMGTAKGRLFPLETGRFAPIGPSLFHSQPTLKSLSSHAQLGSKGDFRFKSGDFHATSTGGRRVRLIQTYAGYDVMGPTVVAEANEDGVFTGEMHGSIARYLDRDIRMPDMCSRNVAIFQDIAIRLEGFDPSDSKIQRKNASRIIYADPTARRAKPAYKVEFFYGGNGTVTWPVYILSACEGLNLLKYNHINSASLPSQRNPANFVENMAQNINNDFSGFDIPNIGICSPYMNMEGGNQKTGRRTFHLNPNCLQMETSGSFCRMEGNYVKVVDNRNSEDFTRQTVISFPCTSGYQDGVNGAYGVASDALFFGEASGKFLLEKFNFRALPYIARVVIHFGFRMENAFWDGTDMYFGDGESYFYPLVSLDVVAHELAHGITTRNSNLVYRDQPGGINEAFSDITGEATEHFVFGSNDWLVGSSITKGDGALRYFEYPPLDEVSIKYPWRYYDGINVHFSSGVFNHVFYVMVEKEGMDIYDAYKCFLDANLDLWGEFTNFYEGACNVMQAAYDNGFDHRKVRRSFMYVGIPLITCDYWSLSVSLRTGESRHNVLVKEERSPVFRIDCSNSVDSPSGVRATAEDSSPVTILVTADRNKDKLIASGENGVNFDLSGYAEVFVTLKSSQKSDVKITFEVL